jgi:hypothetical protein
VNRYGERDDDRYGSRRPAGRAGGYGAERSGAERAWADRAEGRRPGAGRYESERNRAERYDSPAGGRGRRPPGVGGPGGPGPGNPGGGGNGPAPFNVGTIAVLAGVLVVGIGIGTGISSTTQGNQGNIASSQQLDMAVPDPEFCRQWGASAFVMDVEIYTTMNPSSSFVTQPALKPGCVIRRENWSVLQKEGAISAEQMRQCKQRMNTFAYIGSVKDKPVVRCVYQTDIRENQFVTKGVADDTVGVTPEADMF